MRRQYRIALAAATTVALSAGGVSAAVGASNGSALGERPVFLVRSDTTVDASVAAAAAARAGAPLLYSAPGSLDDATRNYVTSYQPTSVVLVGGTASLSATVETSVKALGYTSVRVAGADRSETATKLAALVADLPAAVSTKGAKGDKGDAGASGSTGATGARGPAGPGSTYSYLDVNVTVPEAATTDVDYRASCPAGSHILNGTVRSLSHNAFFSPVGQFADETGGSSAWVFSARHMTPSDSGYFPGDATAVVRIVCAS